MTTVLRSDVVFSQGSTPVGLSLDCIDVLFHRSGEPGPAQVVAATVAIETWTALGALGYVPTLSTCLTDAIRLIDPAVATVVAGRVTAITDTLDGEIFTSVSGHEPYWTESDPDFNGLPCYHANGAAAGHALYLLGEDALPVDPFTVVALVKWSGSYAAIGCMCDSSNDDAACYTGDTVGTMLGLRAGATGGESALAVPTDACVVMAVFNGATAEVHTITPDGTIGHGAVAIDPIAARTAALILMNAPGYASGFAGKIGQVAIATGDRSDDLATIHTDFCQGVLGWT